MGKTRPLGWGFLNPPPQARGSVEVFPWVVHFTHVFSPTPLFPGFPWRSVFFSLGFPLTRLRLATPNLGSGLELDVANAQQFLEQLGPGKRPLWAVPVLLRRRKRVPGGCRRGPPATGLVGTGVHQEPRPVSKEVKKKNTSPPPTRKNASKAASPMQLGLWSRVAVGLKPKTMTRLHFFGRNLFIVSAIEMMSEPGARAPEARIRPMSYDTSSVKQAFLCTSCGCDLLRNPLLDTI